MVALLVVLVGCQTSSPPSSTPVAAPPLPPPEPAAEVAPIPVPAPAPAPIFENPPPEGWVDLETFIPGIRLEIRYHTSDNFTGAPLPGYATPGAWLQKEPAEALLAVQKSLEAQGLGLLVYDAYRPLRGTLAMVAWAERTGQEHLLNGYIARRSGHNKGNTIDLTLVDGEGTPLDMGTPWDTLSEASHTKNATGEARGNREILVAAMHTSGWKNYWREWWHFSFPLEGTLPHRDVPYACSEAREGSWEAPEGWNKPGFTVVPVRAEPCSAAALEAQDTK